MASPSVLVTDTNIWIDLENGGILTEVFGLPYQFLTPDFAIRELVRPKWQMLQALELRSQELVQRSQYQKGARNVSRKMLNVDC